jgi:hypothetical protein
MVLLILLVYETAFAREDLWALKPKGVVLLNRDTEFREIRFFPFFQSMEQPLHLKDLSALKPKVFVFLNREAELGKIGSSPFPVYGAAFALE